MLKLNIYIVENDPFIATMLVQTISSLGHHICGVAPSVDAAIDTLPQTNADLVIADLMLNGYKTGIDLAHYINTHLHIPFIFQSTTTNIELIDQALKAGASALMTKPANKQKLSLAIKSAVKVLV